MNSYFVGPKGENIDKLKELVLQALETHKNWRASHYPEDGKLAEDVWNADPVFDVRMASEFKLFLERLAGTFPYFHPRYAAQMLRDPAIPAIAAYFAALLINPNNHAYEGGPVTTEMEMEVIDWLRRMVGFKEGWGHLTSGGSLANMEALWAVRDYRKKGAVVFSKGSHYSWKRISEILRIDKVIEIDVDENYRIQLDRLEDTLLRNNVMFVVANAGTTGVGALDDVESIVNLREKYGFHLHIDGAYGGYARSAILDNDMSLLPAEKTPFKQDVYRNLIAISRADSITVDPHKHGLAPYGAGSVIYREEALRKVILNTAPYTYHKTDKPNIGMFSLEGSRPGAAAASVWLTHKLIPLNISGFGKIISQTVSIARTFFEKVKRDPLLRALTDPDLDLFCFYPSGESYSDINLKSNKLYNSLSVEALTPPFILSKLVIDRNIAFTMTPGIQENEEFLTSIRAVFIKPYFLYKVGGKTYLDILLEEIHRILE
ncbi:MAG: pyridoxal phosphate-dependent decarboxylase family protein [Candidatus Kryptoniota bacterium]